MSYRQMGISAAAAVLLACSVGPTLCASHQSPVRRRLPVRTHSVAPGLDLGPIQRSESKTSRLSRATASITFRVKGWCLA